ncbi:MAG: YqzL family protein [Dethiobacter sp.]|nr:YqzL family protein [Dethiobacter sp.]MBS3983720.1 YqzL family protein [Dethiobacter sp.]MCL4463491.1 YqzL family protein [Bacillota bacterium]MCL5992758.1 YqzL family protein [Bacillota bacterium]
MFNADLFWRFFERTGSVTAYLLYKQIVTTKRG